MQTFVRGGGGGGEHRKDSEGGPKVKQGCVHSLPGKGAEHIRPQSSLSCIVWLALPGFRTPTSVIGAESSG